MREDDTQQRTTIPYRVGVTPPSWLQPPRAAPAPHSRDAYFTNPDLRLRPREPSIGPMLYFTPSNPRLEVTAWNFPQMHALFEHQKAVLAVPDYRLFVVPENISGATVHHKAREIHLGANFLNRMDYDGMRWVVGHELGHVWRFFNQKAPSLRSGVPLAQTAHVAEVEADIVSACLEGDRAATLRGMQVLTRSTDGKSHPSGPNRRRHIAAMNFAQCLLLYDDISADNITQLWHGIPYNLPNANKKARE